jgi:hypothetical protein
MVRSCAKAMCAHPSQVFFADLGWTALGGRTLVGSCGLPPFAPNSGAKNGAPEFVLLPGNCGSLRCKDKRRMNFIHAGPFDSAALRSG